MPDRNQIAAELEKIAELVPTNSPAGLIAYALLRFAAKISREGGNPVEHLTRLTDINPAFDAASKKADEDAFGKFHGDPEPPPEGQ